MALVEEYSLPFPLEDARSAVDLEALVETYAGLLFRVAHSVLRSRAEAEDAVQDAFVRVLERADSLPEIRDLRVWLVRIVWNLALDRKRRGRTEQLDEEFANSLAALHVPADQAMDEAEQLRAVLREIERLPKGERQAILLSTVDELTTAEMARVLGKSESGVRAIQFRARARLRERLGRRLR